MRSTLILAAGLFVSACGGAQSDTTTTPSADAGALSLTEVASGLENPWGMAFLPSGDLLFTEREAGLSILKAGADTPTRFTGVPAALAEGQGGYFGLALHPDFASNRLIYMAYAKGTDDANATAVMRARLSDDGASLTDVTDIFTATTRGTAYHFGGRLQFMPDGTLLLSVGDAFIHMDLAQTTDNTHGKLLRMTDAGQPAAGNPFADGDGMAPYVYSYGHRNAQGLYVDASGMVYQHEHGPKGGDELNVIKAGTNYGWPVISYGINYDGSILTELTEKEGMAQPDMKWVPSIAPSGMIKYTGDVYPDWTGDLFIGAMNGPKGKKLVRVELDGTAIGAREDLLADKGIAFRDVAQGPDGHLYLATVNTGLDDGAIYRLDIAK